MSTFIELDDDDELFLFGCIDELTDEMNVLTVSEWAEQTRYLPRAVTPMPGYYSYDVAPYLREIADCCSIYSTVREFDFMKGAQIGATVGVIENAIGYNIDHVKSSPCMLLTADAELAKLRLDGFIMPMVQHSGLGELIQSNDDTNARKTGKTNKKLEWRGGGSLLPFGARNADKLRSVSIQFLLEDECDAYPDKVGRDGDPQALAEARTKAYHEVRKIGRISTPLLLGSSRIHAGFFKGRPAQVLCALQEVRRDARARFQRHARRHGRSVRADFGKPTKKASSCRARCATSASIAATSIRTATKAGCYHVVNGALPLWPTTPSIVATT